MSTNWFTAPYDEATGRYTCPYCPVTAPGTVFWREYIRDHILIDHLNLGPFPCSRCGCGFRAKDLLHEHIAHAHVEHTAHYLAMIQQPRQLSPEPNRLAIRYGQGPLILLIGIAGANNVGQTAEVPVPLPVYEPGQTPPRESVEAVWIGDGACTAMTCLCRCTPRWCHDRTSVTNALVMCPSCPGRF